MRFQTIRNIVKRHPYLPGVLAFVAMGIIAAIGVLIFGNQPRYGKLFSNQFEQDHFRGLLTAVSTLGVLSVLLIRKWVHRNGVRLALKTVAVLFVLSAGVLYFYAMRAMTRSHYVNFHDTYHYFLGCKYFEELGYNELYNCHLKADKERAQPRFKPDDWVRDLHSYNFVRAKDALENADCSRFSKARWEEFKKDATFFSNFLPQGAMGDHGYNGTPLSAALFGFVANLPDLTYRSLAYVTLFDLAALIALFAVFVWGYGWWMALIAVLFHFINFGDYYYHASFFRYWWWFTLGVGITCLHKKKHGAAAVFLVLSAMLNIFPSLFIAALGVKIVYATLKHRRLSRPHRVFVQWSIIATLFFGGLSLTNERPIEQYLAFFSNMSHHSNLLTTTRTGFRYNFLYRGGPTPEAARKSGVNITSVYRHRKLMITTFSVVILVFFAFLIVRLDDADAAIVGGFALLFMLFSTVVYYYAFAPLLLLLWVDDLKTKRGILLFALFFFLMAMVYLAWRLTLYRAFVNNTVLTGAFTVYLAVVYIVLGVKTGLFSELGRRLRWKRVLNAERT